MLLQIISLLEHQLCKMIVLLCTATSDSLLGSAHCWSRCMSFLPLLDVAKHCSKWCVGMCSLCQAMWRLCSAMKSLHFKVREQDVLCGWKNGCKPTRRASHVAACCLSTHAITCCQRWRIGIRDEAGIAAWRCSVVSAAVLQLCQKHELLLPEGLVVPRTWWWGGQLTGRQSCKRSFLAS